MSVKDVLDSFEVSYDIYNDGSEGENLSTEKILSRETLVFIYDKRWQIHGMQKLKQIYIEKRFEALQFDNFDMYREIFDEF